MKFRYILVLLLFSIAGAHAADESSAQLKFSGASEAEAFVPNRGLEVLNRGMLRGRDQFSVSWQMVTSTYDKPDYKRFAFHMTAPKDGLAIQGLIFDFERGKDFALYEPRCVLNSKESCDIRAEGIDLDVKSKVLRFTNARFLLRSDKRDRFPADVVVNGALRY